MNNETKPLATTGTIGAIGVLAVVAIVILAFLKVALVTAILIAAGIFIVLLGGYLLFRRPRRV